MPEDEEQPSKSWQERSDAPYDVDGKEIFRQNFFIFPN
jgi:hypothetical protein